MCHDCGGRQICLHGKLRSNCHNCPKCHVHMCEKRAVISTGSVTAYCWRGIEGSQVPATGNEIHNELLAMVMQTFAGPLGMFDHSPRLCTASDRDNVSRFGTLASSKW